MTALCRRDKSCQIVASSFRGIMAAKNAAAPSASGEGASENRQSLFLIDTQRKKDKCTDRQTEEASLKTAPCYLQSTATVAGKRAVDTSRKTQRKIIMLHV